MDNAHTTHQMGSEVDEVADHYWAALVQSSPTLATALGLDLNQDEYDDLSPAGLDAQYRLAMDTLDRLDQAMPCLLYTSPSPRDRGRSRMPSSA